MNLKTIANLAGDAPNEKWMITGQVIIAIGIASYVGFSGFGVQIGKGTVLAPFILMVGGVLMMLYGTKLRKEKTIRERQHELAMSSEKRSSDRDAPDPTEGDYAFWKEFKAAAPVNVKGLEGLKMSHDAKKTKSQLLATVAHLRFKGWATWGKALYHGNVYHTRERFETEDRTVFK